mgnify:CR=1 FL=1
MAGIFKKLAEHDYQVTPFKAHKSYTFNCHNTGSGIYMLEGYDMGWEAFAPGSAGSSYLSSRSDEQFTEPTNLLTTEDDQYHYKRTVWNSVNQLYYKYANEPGKTSGPNSIKTFPYYGETLGDGGRRVQERYLGSRVSVISIPQQTYGERIKPKSITLKDTENNITLVDDGFGNLFNSSVGSGSAISDTGLIGWWSFDEVDTYKNSFITGSILCTKVIDKSLSGNSSIVSGSPNFVSINVSSSAGLYFGSNDYIEGTGSINFPYFKDSVGAYDKAMNVRAVSFEFSGSQGDMIHLSSDDTFNEKSHNWRIGLNGGKVIFDSVIRSGSLEGKVYSSSLSTSNASFNSGVHHCVCQIKNGFKELYMDGTLVASESIIITETTKKKDKSGSIVEFPHPIYPHIKEINNFRIGSGSTSYEGYMDEVRFYNRTLDTDEIKTLHTHPSGLNFVGNVFYSQGLMTITNREQKYKNSFKTPESCSVQYKGDVTIYEHEVTCNINKNEFTHTLNKSARLNHDDRQENLRPELTGSKFSPYVTTIGLYDDEYNLIAIGKTAEPVRNESDIEITFVIRWDA